MSEIPIEAPTKRTEERVFRIMSHPVCNRRHTTCRFWDIIRTDMGKIGNAPLVRESITLELSVTVLGVSETWDGNTLVRLSCPNHLQHLAVTGKTPNVLSAVSGSGVVAITLRAGRDPYFTIDFAEAVPGPVDALLKGRIHSRPDLDHEMTAKEEQMAALGASLIHPRCEIDFSAITADIATGSSS